MVIASITCEVVGSVGLGIVLLLFYRENPFSALFSSAGIPDAATWTSGPMLLAIAFVASIVVHFSFGLSLGLSFLIFFVGWPLVGTLVTIDDDLPGGWSNPDGSEPATMA